MARPVKYPHYYYVRIDDESNSKLLKLSEQLKIKPAVLLRSLVINKLNDTKGGKDAQNIKVIK